MAVETANGKYNQYALKWKRARDVLAGQDAIYAANVAYLPKLKDETQPDYDARKKRTTFYNASWRTVSALNGMMFRKAPVVINPAQVDVLLEDVTLSGVPFLSFIEDAGCEVLSVGRLGIFVDYPKPPETDGPLTLAQAEALGLRPTMQLYETESIIDWQYTTINNRNMLSQVRLQENFIRQKDEFTQETGVQIRVLDLNAAAGNTYRVRVFQKDKVSGKFEQVGTDVVPTLAGKPLNEIPFYFVSPEGSEADPEEPPMLDLFDLNLKHYQVTADYEHACHFTALPTPWVTGYQNDTAKKDKFYIGSTSAWVFPNDTTKVGFLEYTGQGLTALEGNLTRKEAQMAAIGARMLAPEKAGVEAFDTVALRHSGESSILAAIAGSLSRAMTKALSLFCEWAGSAATDISVKVNREFLPAPMDALTLQAYMAAWQNGGISYQTFFDLLQRGDVIAPDVTAEEEQAKIDSAPPLSLQSQQVALETAKNPPDPTPVKKAA